MNILVKMFSNRNFLEWPFPDSMQLWLVDDFIFKVLIWNYARGMCLHLAYYPKKIEHDFLKTIIVWTIKSLS